MFVKSGAEPLKSLAKQAQKPMNSKGRRHGEPEPQRDEIPQRWLLWRRDFKIHWRSLEVHEAWAIEQAVGGANFAQICEGLLEWVDAEQAALVAAGFLKQWISDQLLLDLGIPTNS